MDIYNHHYEALYGRGKGEEKVNDPDDPFLSCVINMFEGCDLMAKIKETDELIRMLPKDNIMIMRGKQCIFADPSGYNILEGRAFKVGEMELVKNDYCIWTWTLEFRKQFLVSKQILKSLPNLRSFVTDSTTRIKSMQHMQYLRLCAMMINCNYVVLTGNEGYFIRDLKLCDGVCCCGKIGGLQCVKCKKAYCSSNCQRSDWKEHKFFCG